MASIFEMYESVKRIDLRNQVPVIIENTKDTILLLNASQLYQLNVSGTGELIKPRYSSTEYEKLKMKMNFNLTADRVDLYYTGDFYRSRDVEVTKKEFYIYASDSKTYDILEKYGDEILDLTEASEEEYANGLFLENLKLYIETVSLLRFK